jgi:hypothetical protein
LQGARHLRDDELDDVLQTVEAKVAALLRRRQLDEQSAQADLAERLSELPDGRIVYDLRHPWSDGTTRVVFEPQSFLEKLAALIPPPRAHLLTYHGVLAPAAATSRTPRARVVPARTARAVRPCSGLSGTGAGRRRYP